MINVALFGLGTGLDLYLKSKKAEISVMYVLDNSVGRSHYKGIPVVSPEEFEHGQVDKVIITSRHYLDMLKQLQVLEYDMQKVSVYIGAVDLI